MWDLDKRSEIVKLQGHQTKCTCLNYDGMGSSILVSGSEDTRVKVWDVRSGKCIMTFKDHTAKLNSVQLSPDSRWVASGGDDGALKIWDIASGKVLSNFAFPGQAVTCIEFNP